MTNIRTPHTATSRHSLRHRPAKTDPSLYSWQRCFARGVDYAICGLLIIIVLPALMTQPLVLMFFVPLLWVILEPVCLLICGTTVGKALFGLRLISYHTKPKYFWRSIAVWLVGLGCGIPVISILTALKTAVTLQQKGEAYWDNRFGFQVIAEPVNIMRTMLLTIAVVLIFAASGIWKKATYLEYAQVAHIAATTPPVQTGGCTGDCLNGFGTYVYADGSKYEGFWKQGEHSKEDPALALTPPPAENQVQQAPEITAQPQGTNIQLNISPEAAQQLITEYNKTAKTPIEIVNSPAVTTAQSVETQDTTPHDSSSAQEQLAQDKAKAEAQRQAEYDRIRAQASALNAISAKNAEDAASVAEKAAEEAKQRVSNNNQGRDQEIQKANDLAEAVNRIWANANEKKRLEPFSPQVQQLEDEARLAGTAADKAKLSVSDNDLNRNKEIQKANNLVKVANAARADANEKSHLAATHLTDEQIDKLGEERIKQTREAHEEHIRQLYRTMPVDTFSTSGMAR